MEMTVDIIREKFEHGIADRRELWSLLDGKSHKLDLVNHILRVILQIGCPVEDYLREFEALAEAQHPDGAWGESNKDKRSGVRNTCFSARNLIRANRILHRDSFRERVEWAVRFVMAQQSEDGSFPDRVWGSRDATSSSMGLLAYAVKEDFGEATGKIHAEVRQRLADAAQHLKGTQAKDGSWPGESAYEAPIGPTCHLLPKLVLSEGRLTPEISAAIDFVISQQAEDGSWDRHHVDHTCDAARGLLLTHSVLGDRRLGSVIDSAVSWLVGNGNRDGLWGTHPGFKTSLTMTTDVLDCFSKYEAHRRGQDLRVFWL